MIHWLPHDALCSSAKSDVILAVGFQPKGIRCVLIPSRVIQQLDHHIGDKAPRPLFVISSANNIGKIAIQVEAIHPMNVTFVSQKPVMSMYRMPNNSPYFMDHFQSCALQHT